jgi:hypothetical protein
MMESPAVAAALACVWCKLPQANVAQLVVCVGCEWATAANLGPMCQACYDKLHSPGEICTGICQDLLSAPCDRCHETGQEVCNQCAGVLCSACTNALHETGNPEFAGHIRHGLDALRPTVGSQRTTGKPGNTSFHVHDGPCEVFKMCVCFLFCFFKFPSCLAGVYVLLQIFCTACRLTPPSASQHSPTSTSSSWLPVSPTVSR